MRVAIVHDDLVQWGGAERMLLAISEIFPQAPIFTSVYDNSNPLLKKYFSDKKIVTSFMQNIPFWKNMYKTLLPLYPISFEQFDFSEFDLVISQTTRFAKVIITKPQTTHVCYCHTPPRFLWNFSGDKYPKILEPYFKNLKVYDQISANRVDYWLAGSKNAKVRINDIYNQTAQVLYPFVENKFFDKSKVFNGGYFLIVSRLNDYKKVDIAVEAFKQLDHRLKIVGVGPRLRDLASKASGNIEFLGSVSDNALISLIAGCKGLIITAEEDFGLTSIEAQAMGKAVLAYGEGGAKETIVEGKTGILYHKQSASDLKSAIEKFVNLNLDPEGCIKNAQKFSKERFKDNLMQYVKKLS